MEKIYIVIVLVLGMLIGFMLGQAYYKNQIYKLKFTIDKLKLEINDKEKKDKKVIKG